MPLGGGGGGGGQGFMEQPGAGGGPGDMRNVGGAFVWEQCSYVIVTIVHVRTALFVKGLSSNIC